MYYSNVTLPEQPEYDVLTYPYTAAEFFYHPGETDWHTLRLYYSSTPFSCNANGGYMTSTDGDTCVRTYLAEQAQWSEERKMGMTAILIPGKHQTGFLRVWSAQDVADPEGRICLRAGMVTEADWTGLKSWLTGLAKGLSWVPFRAAQTEPPVEHELYRFNSVDLPWLPTRIASMSYIVLCYVPSVSSYRAFACNSPACRFDTSTGKLRNVASSYVTFLLAEYVNGKWSNVWSDNVPNNWPATAYKVEPVWSNKDFYAWDGSLYLSGTEPALVEKEVRVMSYDRGVYALGWQLGRRLAEQRSTGQETVE